LTEEAFVGDEAVIEETLGAVVSKVKVFVAVPVLLALSVAVAMTSYAWPFENVAELVLHAQVENAVPVLVQVIEVAPAEFAAKLEPDVQ
jgi:hypothetical protein